MANSGVALGRVWGWSPGSTAKRYNPRETMPGVAGDAVRGIGTPAFGVAPLLDTEESTHEPHRRGITGLRARPVAGRGRDPGAGQAVLAVGAVQGDPEGIAVARQRQPQGIRGLRAEGRHALGRRSGWSSSAARTGSSTSRRRSSWIWPRSTRTTRSPWTP